MILVLGILVNDGIVVAQQHHERGEKAVQVAMEGRWEVELLRKRGVEM